MSRKSDVRLVLDNQKIYRHYRERLINLALSRYQWDNLPEGVNRNYLERTALYKGSVALMKPIDTEMWLSLGYIPLSSKSNKTSISKEMVGRFLTDNEDAQLEKYFERGIRDVYGNPTNIRGIGANGEQITTNEWEILYDNMTRKSIIPDIELYAYQMWLIHQVFNQNVRLQTKPYIIVTNRNKSLTFKNLFNRVLGFEPDIQIADHIDLDDIKTLDMKVPYIGNDLETSLDRTWARALSMLGISSESEKKERLVSDEVDMSRQEDKISGNVGLMNRKEFAETMNKKYNFNIEVTMSDVDTTLSYDPRGRERYGTIHTSNTRTAESTEG